MVAPSKFRYALIKDIVELASEGFSDVKISKYLGISNNTFAVWKKKYPFMVELMKEAKEQSAKESIEQGLRSLVKGAKDEIVTEKYVTTRTIKRLNVETNEMEEVVVPVERTNTTKIKAPEIRAIEVLSRKYYKELDPKSEERDVSSKILEGFTMRQLQEARKSNPIDKGKSIDAEYTKLESDKPS